MLAGRLHESHAESDIMPDVIDTAEQAVELNGRRVGGKLRLARVLVKRSTLEEAEWHWVSPGIGEPLCSAHVVRGKAISENGTQPASSVSPGLSGRQVQSISIC